jgi:hypothetical protein
MKKTLALAAALLTLSLTGCGSTNATVEDCVAGFWESSYGQAQDKTDEALQGELRQVCEEQLETLSTEEFNRRYGG